MAQQFKDKEKKQFYKEIENVLEAISDLKNTEIVRLNETRLEMITLLIEEVDTIKKHFNNSLLG